jgi:hypothetical protein
MARSAILSALFLCSGIAVSASDEAAKNITTPKSETDAYVTRTYDKKIWFPSKTNATSAAGAQASRDFDYDFTLGQLQLAQCSYCYASADDAAYVPATATVTAALESDGGRVLVGYDSSTKTIFVSFRGSEDIRNWIENIKFFKTNPYEDLPDVEVEIGFNNWYTALRDAGLSDAIAAASSKYGTMSLTITGHSAGGSCATLMAFDVTRNVYPGYSLNFVTTFGSPRVGNSEFYDAFGAAVSSALSTRVTHYRDMVPHLPQTLLGYHHVHNEVYFNEDSSSYTICDGSGEDGDCSDSCSPIHCTSVDDHLLYMNVPLGSDNCVAQR